MTIIPSAADFTLPEAWRTPFDLGFSVFPIEHGGKKPLGPWKAYQTERASLDTVRQWAGRESNVGIATGAVSGLIVLDLDSDEAVREAEKRGLPDTIVARTGKGRHVYFRHPGGTIGNRAGLLPGWDIRGDGGYIVAPGSVHPSGAVYSWHNPPGLFELAPMPDWLSKLLVRPTLIEREANKVSNAPAGTRNDQLNKSAFLLGQEAARGTVDADSVKSALAKAAMLAGLEIEETAATVASGLGAGRNNPKRKDPTEDDIALAFTELHGNTLRFDHDAGAWYEWTGTRWQRDKRRRAFTYARELARHFNTGGKANFAAGVERFACADRAHAADASLWDADIMLLGTPGGTVDLKTGLLRPAKPEDYITKQATVAPEAGEPTRWLSFLDEALAGDAGAIRFLQQWFGYCLTGETGEHALAFVYGPGGNGKSVFLNTATAIMGDYAVTAAMETFTASKQDRHSTELAMLNGARLVTASETEEGRAWAEARVKHMTGGDPITARFMKKDNFTFKPQFKLTIAGNHAPALRNVDEAMRRRFNIIPFVTKPAKPDRKLEETLRAEHGKILSWAIAGCLDWQANGLCRTSLVADATADYFESQDVFGQWIEERCELVSGKFEFPTPLYNAWCTFAREAGEEPGSLKTFKANLERRGVHRGKTGGLKVYRGISLRGANHA